MITGKEIWNTMSSWSSGQGPAWNNMWSAGSWGVVAWVAALLFSFIAIGLWIYTSFAYMEIARKLKYKNPWLAWIPFARGAMILQLGGFDWRWIFLWSPMVLLPLCYLNYALGWGIALLFIAGGMAFTVLCYISHWRFFEKRGYYGWFALIPLIGMVLGYLSFLACLAFLIIIGFVAWKDGDMVKQKVMPRAPRAPSRRRSSRSRSSGRARRR